MPTEDSTSVGDAQLVEAARKGHMGAFEELVARYRGKTYARAFSLMRNEEDAMDISQEAWAKIWRRLEQFHGESSFGTWITQIVINLSLDHLRKLSRRRTISIEEFNQEAGGVERHLPIAPANPAERLERRELRERIDQALEKLSYKQRTALVLYEFEELNYKEIAKVMGCSVGTIMSRLYYARRRMAFLLADLRTGNESDQLGFSERVLKLSRAVLRRGGAAGFVAPQSKIHEGYSPSSRLAIRPAAIAIPDPIHFQNTLSV